MKNGEKFHFTELLPTFYVRLQCVIPFTFAGKIYSRSIASINFLHLHSKRSRLAAVRDRAVIGVAIQLLLHLRFAFAIISGSSYISIAAPAIAFAA